MNQKSSMSYKRKSARKRNPSPKHPPKSPAESFVGPPLEGEALECAIVKVLAGPFRQTKEREDMVKESNGATQTAIEAALLSPRVRSQLRPVAAAYLLEQSLVKLRLTHAAGRSALEANDNKSGQTAAFKSVWDSSLDPLARGLTPTLPEAPVEIQFASEFERSVIEDVLRFMRSSNFAVSPPPSGSDNAPSGTDHSPTGQSAATPREAVDFPQEEANDDSANDAR